ncbi:hypothetical protein I79_008616 [Cricetulus griseus]|uniref:Uncharacterized protein n=1 Tax=Cricetulus griseus TaxID=10029 RepID=G3HDN0_CRIGR|nr:hypothetical protein I79_008616 [Cricetulus griseus]
MDLQIPSVIWLPLSPLLLSSWSLTTSLMLNLKNNFHSHSLFLLILAASNSISCTFLGFRHMDVSLFTLSALLPSLGLCFFVLFLFLQSSSHVLCPFGSCCVLWETPFTYML